MKKSTIIIIVVVALLAIWGVSGYNGRYHGRKRQRAMV